MTGTKLTAQGNCLWRLHTHTHKFIVFYFYIILWYRARPN